MEVLEAESIRRTENKNKKTQINQIKKNPEK